MTSPFTDEPTRASAPTLTYRIWIAGDYDQARRVVTDYCSGRGECFAIERVAYVYSGGEEAGVCVTRINYPRFPADKHTLEIRALELADYLMRGLGQQSYSVEGPEETFWFSREKS